MNAYFIFALVLTVAYVIYYAAVITHDLYGKKGTDKKDEEVFDIGAPEDEEESVAVTESETGFSIGSESYDTESAATVPEVPQEENANNPTAAQEKLERLKAEAEERMEDTVPYLSDARTSEEM